MKKLNTIGNLTWSFNTLSKGREKEIWNLKIVLNLPQRSPSLIYSEDLLWSSDSSIEIYLWIMQILEMTSFMKSSRQRAFIVEIFLMGSLHSIIESFFYVNTISANPTKSSNTLKKFVGNSQRIVWMCLTILWGWLPQRSQFFRAAWQSIWIFLLKVPQCFWCTINQSRRLTVQY